MRKIILKLVILSFQKFNFWEFKIHFKDKDEFKKFKNTYKSNLDAIRKKENELFNYILRLGELDIQEMEKRCEEHRKSKKQILAKINQ